MKNTATPTTPSYLNEKTDTYQWVTLRVSVAAILKAHSEAMAARIPYGWGAKPGADLLPARIKSADCSGYVGYLLAHCALGGATGLSKAVIGRGTSWFMDWCKAQGFKQSHTDSGKLKDNALRLGVYTVMPGTPTGHIVLIRNGMTIESYGSGGVGSRPWTGEGWQKKCTMFVLIPPYKEVA